MNPLNYHHLRYFHAVALEGNLTRAAARLNLSQSALSTQIRSLESRLGHDLFERVGRRLELTEVGQITLDYAERIFATGRELVDTIDRTGDGTPPLRVGAISTLSRNFQIQFLKPILRSDDYDIILRSGDADTLLASLEALALDVVLMTEPPPHRQGREFAAHRVAEQSVTIHGVPERLQHDSLREILAHEPVIVPTERTIRMGFNSLVAKLDVQPRIAAEVDDLAMVRLLAREGEGVAVAPAVVLADEIASGMLVTAPYDLEIFETFFAVTLKRNFPHPALSVLLKPKGTSE